MKIDVFKMERMQSTWENVVDYNLSESGVHPLNLKQLLTPAELEALTEIEIGYTQTNGTAGLRENVARLYPGVSPDQILATAGSSEANFLLMWSLIVAAAVAARRTVAVCEEPRAGLERGIERAGPEGAVLVTGSLFLVGEVYAALGGTPFETWHGWEGDGTEARR